MTSKQLPSLSIATPKRLAKAIFEADVPEHFIRSLPPQGLYLALKQNGLQSSSELIEMATIEQCRLMLDFDLWQQDRFTEDNFWEWLDLVDEERGLKLLQKFIKFVDLKLIALLVQRHVQSIVLDEPGDRPPEGGFHTPDGGRTWLRVTIDDETKNFLFNRLLALIFETDADLFYQLLAIPSGSTEAMVEEEAFQDRTRRMNGEGIPDLEFAGSLVQPLPRGDLEKCLAGKSRRMVVEDVRIVQPLIHDSAFPEPLGSFIADIGVSEELEAELTLLANSALIAWAVEFYDPDKVYQTVRQVRGAINIGLESAKIAAPTLGSREIYDRLGLQKLFQAGLARLRDLRKSALALGQEVLQKISHDPEKFSIAACAREEIPVIPRFFKDRLSGVSVSSDKLDQTPLAFESLDEIAKVQSKIGDR